MANLQIFKDFSFDNTSTLKTLKLPIYNRSQLTPVNLIGPYSQEGDIVYARNTSSSTPHGNINYFDGREWVSLAFGSNLFNNTTVNAAVRFSDNPGVIVTFLFINDEVSQPNSVPISLDRVDNVVTMTFPLFIVEALSGDPYNPTDTMILSAPPLAERFRPITDISSLITVENPHGFINRVSAELLITKTGQISVRLLTGTWAGVGSEVKGTSVSYKAQ